jgi:hypothetical protein
MSITDEDVATFLFNELWTKNLHDLRLNQKQDLAIKLWDATLNDDLTKYKKFLKTQNHKGLITLNLITEKVQKLLNKKIKAITFKFLQRSYDKEVEKEEAAALAAAKRDNEERLRKAADKAAGNLKLLSNETKEKQLVNAPVAKNQDDDDEVRTAIPYAHVYQPPGQPPAKPKKKSGFSCFPFCGNDDALDGGRKHKKRKTRKHKKRKTRKHKKRKTRKHKKRKTRKHKKRKIKKTRKHKKKKTKRKTRRKR